jgi:hypothetical protein
VWPFFGDEIGIVGDHVHECGLGIFGGIKDVVELQERCRGIGLDNGCRYNKEMEQSEENDHIFEWKREE